MKAVPNEVDRLFRQHRGKILGLCILTILQSLLQVAMAVLSRFVIDAALKQGTDLLFWGAMLVADMLALVAAHGLLMWTTGKTADIMTAKLRQGILQTAVYSRNEELLGYHSGELLSRGIEDTYTVCEGVVNVLPTFVGQVTRLVATFGAILLISPSVAAVLAAIAVVVGIASACLRPVLRKNYRLVRETDEKVMSTMQEDLQQLELIQSISAQKQILTGFAGKVRKNLQARFRRRVWSVGTNGVINAVSQIGSGVLLLWGAFRVGAGLLSFGSLTAMLQLLSSFRGPVLGLSGLWTRFASIEVAAERLSALLHPVETARQLEETVNVSAVIFEDVTFSYPSEETPVLEKFNFVFPLDGWTCLTGISGRGKTTIFKLILGLYAPQSGRIYLQTDKGEIPCTEATRQLFAYVPQDYALFSGTILENLLLVAPDVDGSRLRQVLAVAQADYVWELTDKEHTQVRENNAGLSMGQIQRLAIARAVLMDRPIFLLDECTSALDAQTEDGVLRALRALGKQAILVTHRPDALQGLEDVTSISMEQ